MGRHKEYPDPDKQYPDQDKRVGVALRKSRKRAHAPYPDEAIVLALSVIQNGGSTRDASTAVYTATGRRPGSGVVQRWAQKNGEVFAKLQPEKRREWESLAGEVFEAWAGRALEAAEARRDDGEYVVGHTQAMVPFGIAKDGLSKILEAVQGRSGTVQVVQFNLVGADGKRIEEA